jgi:SAM-dependent methyltransferase
MNPEHQVFCSSVDWSDYVRDSIAEPLLRDLALGDDMLEVGPGTGAATDFLRHRVRSLTALELDQSAAATLATRFAGTNVTVIEGDCTTSGLPDDSFDSIASFTMLHHIPSVRLQHAMLGEAFRMLRPGGCLIGSDSLASDDLHHFHAGDTYNPVEPVWLVIELRTLGFNPITVRLGDELVFSALKPSVAIEEDRR